jgi:hypothetical protein
MPGIENFANPYDRRAKLYPMVLTLLPLAFGIAAWSPPEYHLQGVFGSTIVAIAVSSFLTQLARDQGKRKEPSLFRMWGGRPSDRALSYTAGVFSPITLARRHRVLSAIDSTLKFPDSAEAEAASPNDWAPSYAAATELLLARTRDHSAFSLLLAHNIDYGYRRNLWGMKPAGVLCSALGVASSLAKLGVDSLEQSTPSSAALVGITLCVVLLVLWTLRVTPAWVKVPADSYARQLVESCDRLGKADTVD